MSALWRLRSVDALTIDPAGLRLAARIPQWLEPMPGSTTARIAMAREGEAERVETLALMESHDPAELRQLAAESLAGTHVYAYRLSTPDAARLRLLQAEARAGKASPAHRKGSVKITLDARACRLAEPPEGPVLIDLFLSLGDGTGYFKILEDVDIREWQKPGEPFEAMAPVCGKSGARVVTGGGTDAARPGMR
jgi:hypothetical protein